MTISNFKVVVLGMGVQGKKRAKVAANDLLATVDIDKNNLDANYNNITDINDKDYDAILLCTPDDVKFKTLKNILNNKKHVLVEKPLFVNCEEELLELQMEQSIMRNQLASLVGLNTQKFNLIPLNSKKITSILDEITVLYLKDKELLVLQEISLTKRLDLRKALSNYAIAEAKLKLEVAEQYPDYTFSPAYAYEFGTKLWSLGVDSILKSTNRNKAFINKAEKFRDLEASKVDTLQLTTINDIEALQLNFLNKFDDLR